MTAPLVSVLMYYHNANFLEESIKSIINQTFPEFEFIIFDDVACDDAAEMVRSFSDPRIKLVFNKNPLGLARSLNIGMDLARGKYLARMDSDDISSPERFIKEVEFMENNPELGVCGSAIKFFGEKSGEKHYPTDSAAIKCRLLFRSAFAHPTVMMRRNLFNKYGLRYDPVFKLGQDYDLWTRAAECFPMGNLDKILLLHRIHPGQAGYHYNLKSQSAFAEKVQRKLLKKLRLTPTKAEMVLHASIGAGTCTTTPDNWFAKLKYANSKCRYFPEPTFSNYLTELYEDILHH